MTGLRKRELCPLHHSYWCCGRNDISVPPEKPRQERRIKPDVERVDDPHHPRGYREVCSPREQRRRKKLLIAEGQGCLYCDLPFVDYRGIELAHKQSKGMGGGRRDDHMDNLALAHRGCNFLNGSKSIIASRS